MNRLQKLPQKNSFASNKIFTRWWPWVQTWFRGRNIITTNPGRPSSISPYYQTLLDGAWSVRILYPFRCSYSLVLDHFLNIYFLFSVSESPSLVKNIEVECEIKPRHPISRGNMSVDQPFLIHGSRKSSYFSNSCWFAQSMLSSKGSLIQQG